MLTIEQIIAILAVCNRREVAKAAGMCPQKLHRLYHRMGHPRYEDVKVLSDYFQDLIQSKAA